MNRPFCSGLQYYRLTAQRRPELAGWLAVCLHVWVLLSCHVQDMDLAAMPVLCCIAANAYLVPSQADRTGRPRPQSQVFLTQVAEFTRRVLELDDKACDVA